MIKTLKHFFLLFVFIFSIISAETKEDQYRLYVTMVDPEFHCFALSNHMVFNIPEKNWDTTELPEVGTEVYIIEVSKCIPDPEHGCEFVFGYSQDRAKKSLSAWITPESKQYGLSCALSVESVCIAPAGRTFPAEFRDVLSLSDGSRWIKKNKSKTTFGPESRLVISKQFDGSYSIIDLDEADYLSSSILKNRRRLTWHRYEQVVPLKA